jgi:hypothetical protein
MTEKTLKTATGKLKICFPGSLDEVTLGQLLELQEKPDLNDLEAISILSGTSLERLQNVQNANDFHEFTETMYTLSQQLKLLYKNEVVPKKVIFQIGGAFKTINVIRNLSVEPAGAFMAARDIITEEISDHIKKNGADGWQASFNPSLRACCQVLAHYFYCRVTGKLYNEYDAEEFCDEIKKLRVTEALPVAKHFFTCYPNLSKQKTSFFRRLLPRSKKRQAYDHSKSLSISIP